MGIAVPSALAQSAVTATWDSSITYYTPDPIGGTMQVDYYDATGAQYSATPIALSGHKAGSLYIGSVGALPASFSARLC